jgi:PIN domain nuclease of toxin-antitoxin system
MAALVVDTHAAVWYLLNSSRLSTAAQRAMDDAADAGDPVYLSAVSLVEIVILSRKEDSLPWSLTD